MSVSRKTKSSPAAPVRCAVYTRKSTEEGLDTEFSSLDAQREAAEAYIHSQAHAGWTCLEQRYDDGGYTGSNLDRPALQRLLTDIQAGQIDCALPQRCQRPVTASVDREREAQYSPRLDRKSTLLTSARLEEAFGCGKVGPTRPR